MKNLTAFLLAAGLLCGAAPIAFAQSPAQEQSDSIKTDGAADNGTTDNRMIQIAGSNADTAQKILTDAAGNLTTIPAAGAVSDVNVMRTGPTPGTALAVPIDADTGAGTTNYLPVIVRTPGAAGTGLDGVAVRSTTEGITSTGNSLEVAIVAGQDGIAGGTGLTGANVPRVTLATDVGLPAGANILGAVDVRVGGGAATGGSGVVGANTLRVAPATDVRVAVDPISGQVGIAGGTGVDGATVPRVSLATNVGLPAGANTIGAVDLRVGAGAASAGSGIATANTLRVTQATDVRVEVNPISGQTGVTGGSGAVTAATVRVAPALDVNAPVNQTQMNGVAVSAGNGISGTGVQRVTIASDSTGTVAVIQATASSLNAEVQGDAAHSAPVSGNPVFLGAFAEADAAALDSTTVVEGDASRLKSDIEGRLLVRSDHPNRIRCTSENSSSTSLVNPSNCGAPGASLAIYVTDVTFSASVAASTTANEQMQLVEGTQTTTPCDTAASVIWSSFNAANASVVGNFTTPIRVATNNQLCWRHAAVGNKSVVVQGYIAP